ncbi:MAG: DUF4105 domain-containing protein [Bacteroidales bacterium]|nr:DUF4105 domain-containing protein [Bacteroidales bacterium]
MRISLLTCSPHDEVYSLYGHTALRVEDPRRGMDLAVNYGMFSFAKPFFVLRFVFGLTDYEMGIVPFEVFCREYEYYGSSVTQQTINLTETEKQRIIDALLENYKPENRVYRYNFYYDNCTTRACDMVTENIDGKVVYDNTIDDGMTMRQMLHRLNNGSPWSSLGNDLLLGIGADRPLHGDDTRALPLSAMRAMEKAYIVGSDGVRRKLVEETSIPVREGRQWIGDGFPLTPVQCSVILLAVVALLSLLEWKIGRYMWMLDALLLTSIGICGLIITAMIGSQHPTVRTNIQILLFNPLPLLFGWKAIRNRMRGRCHWMWKTGAVMICLMVVLFAFEIQWLDPAVKILSVTVMLRYALGIVADERVKARQKTQPEQKAARRGAGPC